MTQLTMAGQGTQVLSGPNAYTGSTAVNSGKLYLNGTNATSAISVAGGATLGGNGSATSATATVADTGIVEAGFGGLGSLSLGGLTFNNTATVNIANVGNYSGSPAVNVLNSGGLTVNGAASSVTINLSGALPSSGTAELIEYNGSIGGTGSTAFTLNTTGLGAGPRALFSLSNPAGFVDLVYSTDHPVWTGLGSGNWITSPSLYPLESSPTNWVLASNSSTQTNFIAGDAAEFNDNASGTTTVTISAANVAPSAVTFNNSAKNYTLTGAYGISDVSGGTTALTKSGTGLLTITNTNTYSGGTTINGGTLQLGDGATANGVIAGNATTNAVLAFANPSGQTFSGNIGGSGAVEKSAAGELVLSGNNTYGGGMTLNSGKLTLASATALGGAASVLTINGGTLDSGAASLVQTNNNPQVWNSDFHFAGTNDLNLGAGTVSLGATAGARTVTVDAGTLTVGGIISDGVATGLTKAGAGTLVLGGANTYDGGTTINAGTVTMNSRATSAQAPGRWR